MGSLFLLRLQITVWIVFKRQNRQWTPKTWTSGAVLAKTARTRKSFNNVHNVYWRSSQLYQIPQNTKKYWIFSGAKYREKSKKKKKKKNMRWLLCLHPIQELCLILYCIVFYIYLVQHCHSEKRLFGPFTDKLQFTKTPNIRFNLKRANVGPKLQLQ